MNPKHILHIALIITCLTGLTGIRPAPAQAQTTFDCSAVTEIPQAECQALVALYNATWGVYWYNQTGWLQTTSPCSWFGVTCINGYVALLSLPGNNLRGPLPQGFGNLTGLTTLNLEDNELSTLPPEFGNLVNLVELNLKANGLTSLPPEFGNLAKLTRLDLGPHLVGCGFGCTYYFNHLSTLPPEFGNLTNLTILNLSGNDLTTLPPEFGNLSSLAALTLTDNPIVFFPSEVENLPALTYLDMSKSNLTSLPAGIEHFQSLSTLNLEYNDFTSFPVEIENLAHLTFLNMNGNKLTSLPDSFGNLANLTCLELEVNKLTTLPDSIGNLTNLTTLNLAGNDLTTLPSTFGNLINLTSLKLGGFLTTLPDNFGNLSNLTHLELLSPALTTLPPVISNLTHLTSLVLLGGSLTSLPPEIGNLSNLTHLELSNDNLTALPPEIGNLSNLTSLRMKGSLSSLPPEIGNLTRLSRLELFYNNFTSLPPEIGNLTSLEFLGVSYSKLAALPPEIGNLSNLTKLNLDKNALTTLPPEFGNLTNLTSLELYSNPLHGMVPRFMTRLTALEYLGFNDTGWCVPPDGPIYEWLSNIPIVVGGYYGRCTSLTTLNLNTQIEQDVCTGASLTADITFENVQYPVTFTWSTDGIAPIVHTRNTITDTASLYWDTPGAHTLTITAANEINALSITRTIFVQPISSTIVLPDAPASLTYTDTQGLPTTLDLPAGSVTQTAALLYRPQPDPAIIPAWRPAGHSFSLDLYREGRALSNITFTHPITLTLHYSEADIANVDRPADLQLMHRDTNGWQPAACGPISRDLEQRVISLPLCQLGEFALFGPATLTKFGEPAGFIENGDALTYTLVFSNPEGGSLRLFDPLSPTLAWNGFVSPPPGNITFAGGVISGALTLSPTHPLTLSFTVSVTLPQTAAAPLPTAVANTAFFCWAQHTACIFQPSNTVANPLIATRLFLPLLLRTP